MHIRDSHVPKLSNVTTQFPFHPCATIRTATTFTSNESWTVTDRKNRRGDNNMCCIVVWALTLSHREDSFLFNEVQV